MRLNPNTICDFLELDKTPNAYGEPRNTWAPVFEGIFCEVSPLLGRDFVQSFTAGSTVDVKIRCRWFDGVKSSMRVKAGEDIFEIESAINVSNNNRELLMYCRRVRE